MFLKILKMTTITGVFLGALSAQSELLWKDQPRFDAMKQSRAEILALTQKDDVEAPEEKADQQTIIQAEDTKKPETVKTSQAFEIKESSI